jgi:hypothetical protein
MTQGGLPRHDVPVIRFGKGEALTQRQRTALLRRFATTQRQRAASGGTWNGCASSRRTRLNVPVAGAAWRSPLPAGGSHGVAGQPAGEQIQGRSGGVAGGVPPAGGGFERGAQDSDKRGCGHEGLG